ncbi:Hypothetical protein A7982_05362 [Minicystis rosea]|nr:Hypothetical protein A7982_05362 [Minicystis rosea]
MMGSLRSSSFALVAFVSAAALIAPAARADNVDPTARSTARKLGQDALKLYDSGDYGAALEKFNTADSLVPAPTLGLYAARCLVKLGRLVEASERYLEVTRMQLERGAPSLMRKAQAEAVTEREKLLPTIPMLEVKVDGPQGDGVTYTFDDKPMLPGLVGEKRPVDPGKHRATVKRADIEVAQEIIVKGSEAATLVLKLPPLPPRPIERMPPLRVAGWVGIGVGIAGGLFGAVNGVLAITQQQSLASACTAGNTLCPPSVAGKIATYNVVTKLTTIGIITGIAGLGFGIPAVAATPKTEWVHPDGRPASPPKDAPKVSIEPWLTWGGAGVSGTF